MPDAAQAEPLDDAAVAVGGEAHRRGDAGEDEPDQLRLAEHFEHDLLDRADVGDQPGKGDRHGERVAERLALA